MQQKKDNNMHLLFTFFFFFDRLILLRQSLKHCGSFCAVVLLKTYSSNLGCESFAQNEDPIRQHLPLDWQPYKRQWGRVICQWVQINTKRYWLAGEKREHRTKSEAVGSRPSNQYCEFCLREPSHFVLIQSQAQKRSAIVQARWGCLSARGHTAGGLTRYAAHKYTDGNRDAHIKSSRTHLGLREPTDHLFVDNNCQKRNFGC